MHATTFYSPLYASGLARIIRPLRLGSEWTAGAAAGGDTDRLGGFFKQLEEGLDDVDRHREDNRGILLGADHRQRLQVTQLHGGRNGREDLYGCRNHREDHDPTTGMINIERPMHSGGNQ